MSFKKAFTKMGLVEEEIITTKPQPTRAAATMRPTSYSAPKPAVDEGISKTLQQSLQENKLSGFDYLKFIASTEEMKVYGTPEEARYKMAFSAAKQLGVDKNALIQSAQHYLDVLKQDETAFESEFVQPELKKVKAKETKIADLEARLTSLQEEIARAKENHDSLVGEVQENKANVDSQRESFQITLKSFVDNIEANITKITQYLS
jgi:hypothetical protein